MSPVEQIKPPSILSVLPATFFLFFAGWGGLAAVIYFSLPTLGPRWLFFFLLVMGVSGTFLPVVYFINRRFPSHPPADTSILVRQALWFGVYGAALAWLQLGRMLSAPVAGALAGGLALVEALLRMREISRWKPKE
jgi:hypothetical protein